MSKKIIINAFISIFICTSIFAQNEQADVYTDIQDETAVNIETADIYEDEILENNSTKNKKKSFSDIFKFGNKDKYITLDESSCFSKNALGSLKQYTSDITLDPELSEAGFGTKYLAGYYFIFMNAENRVALKNAMEQYFSDFENKKLKRKGKHLEKVYGKLKIRLRWGTIKTSTPSNGEGFATLGYEFVNNSPYFKISIPEIENEYYKVTTAVNRGSPRISLYFTKSQISSLVEMISNENIAQSILDYNQETYGTPTENDDY